MNKTLRKNKAKAKQEQGKQHRASRFIVLDREDLEAVSGAVFPLPAAFPAPILPTLPTWGKRFPGAIEEIT